MFKRKNKSLLRFFICQYHLFYVPIARAISVLEFESRLCNSLHNRLNAIKWEIWILFSFLSKTNSKVNEMNLFDKFRLLTYFCDVLFGQNELGSNFELRNKPQPLYSE